MNLTDVKFPVGSEPSVRDFHTTVCIKNKVYLFGGRGTAYLMDSFSHIIETYSNVLWCFDLTNYTWHRPLVMGDVPCGRRSHSACEHFPYF